MHYIATYVLPEKLILFTKTTGVGKRFGSFPVTTLLRHIIVEWQQRRHFVSRSGDASCARRHCALLGPRLRLFCVTRVASKSGNCGIVRSNTCNLLRKPKNYVSYAAAGKIHNT